MQQNIEFEWCIDFLVRMIDKYKCYYKNVGMYILIVSFTLRRRLKRRRIDSIMKM